MNPAFGSPILRTRSERLLEVADLYELITPARGGYQKEQEFGVRFASARVVIYVEPDVSSGQTTASTSQRLHNRLEINEDFRVFQDTMDRWMKRRAGLGGGRRARGPRLDAQILVETVLGAQGLRQRSRYWDDQGFDAMLSEEALTAAVQPRYFIEERLKRDLASRRGHRQQAAAA